MLSDFVHYCGSSLGPLSLLSIFLALGLFACNTDIPFLSLSPDSLFVWGGGHTR